MSSYYHALDPNGRDPVLGDCNFHFDDLEVAPGIVLAGYAEIETDGSNYRVGDIVTGFGFNDEWQSWPIGHPVHLMAATTLVSNFDDAIIEACIEAGA